MRIFLTGATGFVGRNYLEWVLREQPEAQITCLVRDPRKAAEQWPDQPRQVHWLAGDLLQPHTYQRELEQAELVVHAAALVSLRNGPEFYAQNTEATQQLLSGLAHSTHLQRLIFVSSISAIDRSPEISAVGPLTEASQPHPNTDYGRSKWQAEEAVRISGLPHVIMRPAYIYGPYPRPNSSMDRMAQHVLSGKPYTRFPFPGRASAIYVDDLSEMLWVAGYHPAIENQAFFISDPEPVLIRQAFTDLAQAMRIPFETLSLNESTVSRTHRYLLRSQPENMMVRILFEDYFYCSPNRWFERTGTSIRYGYAEGLSRTIDWMRRHQRLQLAK